MYSLKTILTKSNADSVAFGFIVMTFFFLPIGTAPPLISIGLAFAVWLFSKGRNSWKLLVKKEWFLPALAFVILPWVGLFYSKDYNLGIDYALKTKYWIAVFIIAGTVFNEERIEILMWFFWGSLSIGGLLAILQYCGVVEQYNPLHIGFGIVHTLISIYLLVGIFNASFYFRIVKSYRRKVLILLLMTIFIIHLAILQGRNGYFVFILLTPFIANNLMYKFKPILKTVVFLMLISSLLLSPVVQKRANRTIGQINQKQTILKGEWDERFTRPFMFHSTVKLIMAHPFMGIGTGSLKYYTEKKGHPVSHPHNSLLYMTVSFGIMGFIAYLWLFWKMFILSWKNRESLIGNLVLSICLVLFLGGVFETPILNTGTALLLPMGYGLLNHLDSKVGIGGLVK